MNSRRFARALGRAAIALCLVTARSAAADQPEARRILTESELRHRVQSYEYLGEVIVIPKSGRERRKRWMSYREGHGPSVNRLIRFLSPPEVRGVGFLSRGRPDGNTDQWLYLPSMQRERRIAARERESAFVGTDFNYEDIGELDTTRYDASLLPSEIVDGQPAHIIELIPRTTSLYARRVVAIRKDTLSLVRIEFYDSRERRLSKRLVLTDFLAIDGHVVATRLEMSNLRTASRTVILLHDIVLNRPQPANRFTIQNLVRDDDGVQGSVSVGVPDAARADPRGQLAGAAEPRPARAGMRGLTGFAEGKILAYATDEFSEHPGAVAWGTLFLRQRLRLGPVRVAAALRLEQASSSEVGPLVFDPADRELRRSPISLRELSVVVPVAGTADVEVGRFTLAWGQTDGYSPADAFLPRDTSDLLDDEKLPLWGVRLRGERGPLRIEAVAVATTTPWRLPVLDGRDSPLSSIRIYLREPEVTRPPRAGFQAIRIVRAGADWDIGGWVRTGVRPVPLLDPQIDSVVTTDEGMFVTVRRRFPREMGVGLELAREYRGWVLRGELSAMRSSDPGLGDAVIWTVGTTRGFRTGMFTATVAMNAIDPPVDPLLLFDRSFLPGFVMAVRQSENWGSWKIGWLGTFQRVGGVLVVELSKDLSDVVKLTVGAGLPHGAAISPARALGGHNHGRATLRWSW